MYISVIDSCMQMNAPNTLKSREFCLAISHRVPSDSSRSSAPDKGLPMNANFGRSQLSVSSIGCFSFNVLGANPGDIPHLLRSLGIPLAWFGEKVLSICSKPPTYKI